MNFNMLVVFAAGIVIYWAAAMIVTAWLMDIKINCFKKKQPEVHNVIEEIKEVELIKDYSKEFKELSDKYGRKPTPIDELCNSFMNEK